MEASGFLCGQLGVGFVDWCTDFGREELPLVVKGLSGSCSGASVAWLWNKWRMVVVLLIWCLFSWGDNVGFLCRRLSRKAWQRTVEWLGKPYKNQKMGKHRKEKV